MANDNDLPDITQDNVDGPSGPQTLQDDADPYAGKEQALGDITQQTKSLMDIGNEVDAGDTIYNPRVASDNGGPSKHGQVVGTLASLLTGDPRIGASVAQHMDAIGAAKYDNSMNQNLQNFANLLTTQNIGDGKALAATNQKEAETADKASSATSQRVEAQMIADAMQKSQSQSKGGGGGDGGGGDIGSLLGF